jgi:phosphatidylglycerophosphate synthase
VWRQVPNLITGARLLLAIVFFALLSGYQYQGRGHSWLLHVAFVIYFVALLSDWLDGYLARKWQADSAFGRIVDPFVDKVLVLGSFIFFAGKNFIIPDTEIATAGQPMVVKTITGIAPGIVVLLLGRELLVTSLRAASESAGKSYGAEFSGKLKMVFQSITILVILVYVNALPLLTQHNWVLPATIIRDACIWATVFITVLSGWLYVKRSVSLLKMS